MTVDSSIMKYSSAATDCVLCHFEAVAQQTSVKLTDLTQYNSLLVTSGYELHCVDLVFD